MSGGPGAGDGARRTAKLRHRAPRFDNRTRPAGWSAPSLHHRVETPLAWVERLRRLAPVSAIGQEYGPRLHGTAQAHVGTAVRAHEVQIGVVEMEVAGQLLGCVGSPQNWP